MMLCRIIFCTAVILAILSVILLALFSPKPHNLLSSKDTNRPWLALSLYVQQPQISTSSSIPHQLTPSTDAGAFVFHHSLTEGPENTSRIIGKAQGFIIPLEHFARSAFNVIYLTFNTKRYSGSLSVQAKHIAHMDREELTVIGGTGSFAFARGVAVFAQSDELSIYHVKLQLNFPNRSHTIPG
ncbi:pterocarpan synthase 1-like [Mercurialis annua]|uniref:pterocarpan synthase 1-like n=1 Tax=Mercurialis annua TaxID=3986 RepID=UPI002160E793|nr:pterocarpan synthase 1-like [Mercurialis annua]